MKKSHAKAKSTKKAGPRATRAAASTSLLNSVSMPEPFLVVRRDVVGKLLLDPDWAVENMRRLVAYYSTHDEYGEKIVVSSV